MRAIPFILLMLFAAKAHGLECTTSSSDASGTAINPLSGLNSCTVTPEAINVTLYDVGICTAAPSVNTNFTLNYSDCVSLYTNNSGQSIALSNNTKFDLNEEITLDEGIYTHAYLLVGSTFSVKTKFEFNYTATTEDNAQNSGSGQYCYTDGSSYALNHSSNMTCSADSSLPGYDASSEYLVELFANYPGSGGTNNYYPNASATIDGITEKFDLFTLNSSKAIDGTNTLTPVARPYIAGVQQLSSPITITGSETNIDTRVSVTNGVFLGFAPNGSSTLLGDDYDCTTVGGCLVDALWGGLGFRFVAF